MQIIQPKTINIVVKEKGIFVPFLVIFSEELYPLFKPFPEAVIFETLNFVMIASRRFLVQHLNIVRSRRLLIPPHLFRGESFNRLLKDMFPPTFLYVNWYLHKLIKYCRTGYVIIAKNKLGNVKKNKKKKKHCAREWKIAKRRM